LLFEQRLVVLPGNPPECEDTAAYHQVGCWKPAEVNPALATVTTCRIRSRQLR